jgi:hypothetical protein
MQPLHQSYLIHDQGSYSKKLIFIRMCDDAKEHCGGENQNDEEEAMP